jgi:hypothetical protein
MSKIKPCGFDLSEKAGEILTMAAHVPMRNTKFSELVTS